jgi:hypothetical protein
MGTYGERCSSAFAEEHGFNVDEGEYESAIRGEGRLSATARCRPRDSTDNRVVDKGEDG